MSASTISKRKIILWFGVLVAAMPFLGFPTSWKTLFYFVAGVLIAWNSYQLNKHRQVKQRRKSNKKAEEMAKTEEKNIPSEIIIEDKKEETIENTI